MDLISVITPAYNVEDYIAQTIDSVLAQTYTSWEMLIVDDGSTDRTAEIIKEYCLKDKRIRYFFQKNGKQAKARNLAIQYAQGKYVAFLDADDLWVPEKLQKQIEIIQLKDVDVVYSQGWSFKEVIVDSRKETIKNKMNTLIGFHGSKQFLTELLKKNQVPVLSVLVKKEVIDSINGFVEDAVIQRAEDYQLFIRLADRGFNFFGMQDRLFHYRIHDNQSTHNDVLAMAPTIWAIENISFVSISQQQKESMIIKMLNKFVLFEVENAPSQKLNQLINLYKTPLNNYFAFLSRKLLLFFGTTLFKKIGYRFFKLA